MTWREYDRRADAIASGLVAAGYEPGDRYAVQARPTAPTCTRRTSAASAPGVVSVGIGPRAGEREVAHLLERTGARGFADRRRCRTTLPGGPPPADRALGPDDLWMLNSTSGTTGLPEVRDARAAAVVRVPPARGRGRRPASPTTCSRARCPRRSASVCGPRTSRPRSSARRASCSRASRPRR